MMAFMIAWMVPAFVLSIIGIYGGSYALTHDNFLATLLTVVLSFMSIATGTIVARIQDWIVSSMYKEDTI